MTMLPNNPGGFTPPIPMQKRYLHIGFKFDGSPYPDVLKPVFDLMSDDWVRYGATCWITYTRYDSTAWFNAIKPYLRGNDSVLILELRSPQSMLIQGWLPNFIWEWLGKVRS